MEEAAEAATEEVAEAAEGETEAEAEAKVIRRFKGQRARRAVWAVPVRAFVRLAPPAPAARQPRVVAGEVRGSKGASLARVTK